MEYTEIEKEVHKVLDRRQEKGREEYGTGLHTHQNSDVGWLNEAIEEAADLLQYLVAMKCKMQERLEEEANNTPLNVCVECGLPADDCKCNNPSII